MKKLRIMILVFVSGIVLGTAVLFAHGYSQKVDYHKAKIESIERFEESHVISKSVISLRLLDGEKKGSIVKVNMDGKESTPLYVRYKVGQTVFVGLNKIESSDHKEEYVALYDVDNTFAIILFSFVFLVILLAVARTKGLISFIGLFFTVVLLFFIFVPLTLNGFPPILSAVIVSILSILATIPMITGLKKKTAAAAAGAVSGVLTSVVITVIMGAVIHVSGIINDDLMMLFYVTDVNIDIRDVALSGMIIASLGAVIDVSVSVASAVEEFFHVHPEVDRKQAFVSAMKVGRDNLGSMINTLVMAYVGSSLSLVLLIAIKTDAGMPMSMIINNNQVLVEILKSFAGCIGMTAAVPVTAYLCVRLHCIKTSC
jgi:uncharacterized membrane protein